MRLGLAIARTTWSPAAALDLPSEQRQLLQAWIDAKKTPQKVAFRARVIPVASEAHANRDIARTLGASRPTVLLWCQRFTTQGPQALLEGGSRRGRKVQTPVQKVQAIIDATLYT
jgi:hypothetical protein